MPSTPILDSCLPMLARYPAVICDIWGVLHDGITAYDGSNETLARYRAGGGKVVLLSNSPQLAWQIEKLLARKNVSRSVYDSIVTSGEITIRVVNALNLKKVFHIGPGRHDPLYDGQPYARVELENADSVICTGFYNDDYADMASYKPLLDVALEKNLPFICANPDLIVDVGGVLYPCAGALAKEYEKRGGTVHWAGKPHRLAFEMASEALMGLGFNPQPENILMIGDTLRTDVAGAAAMGFATLFIAQGIHRQDVAPQGEIDARALDSLLAESGARPNAAAFTLKP